jgi:hypothetical protein
VISKFRSGRFWVAANVVGAAAFLWFASKTWIEPALRHEDVARGGDAILWAVTALPVLIAFLVLDLIWLTLVMVKLAKSQAWHSALPVAAMGLLWLGVIFADLAMR